MFSITVGYRGSLAGWRGDVCIHANREFPQSRGADINTQHTLLNNGCTAELQRAQSNAICCLFDLLTTHCPLIHLPRDLFPNPSMRTISI